MRSCRLGSAVPSPLRGLLGRTRLVASVVLASASFAPVAVSFVLASAVGFGLQSAVLSRGLPALSERPGSVTFGMRMRGTQIRHGR